MGKLQLRVCEISGRTGQLPSPAQGFVWLPGLSGVEDTNHQNPTHDKEGENGQSKPSTRASTEQPCGRVSSCLTAPGLLAPERGTLVLALRG